MKTTIFVYGTLRKNYRNHAFLSTANFVGEAKTQNKYVMHCGGIIPFVSESQAISQIVGEVYEVDHQTLADLDQLEGCIPSLNNPAEFDSNSWYTRKQVEIELTDRNEVMLVWMYFNEKANHHPIISTGDYNDRERLLLRNDRVWYFAYGSNMDVAQMLTRNAPFTYRKKGRIYGQRLVFNKIADRYPGYGYANIVPQHGFEVMGVLYEINESGLLKLDEKEGVSCKHYFRSQIEVLLDDGTTVEAMVYLAHPSRVNDGMFPTKSYMDHLYKGLDILGDEGKAYLDHAYLESRVTNDAKFVALEDIPAPNPEKYRDEALPVLINGHKAKMYFYDCTWSPRLVFFCEPEEMIHFEAMKLRMDDRGFYGTKYFQFLRRGILQLGEERVIAEMDNKSNNI
jgi:gamma-glutamylcyclotransferase (GGCT)/AIG2-like uncharacterized protein YtfP